MTWHVGMRSGNGARLCGGFMVLSLLGAVGCGGGATAKTLTITDPTADAELSASDDTSEAMAGLQYTVTADSSDLPVGTEIELVVGQDTVAKSEVATGGKVTFSDATLPPGVKRILARTVDLSVSSDESQQYAYRMLEISSPSTGDAVDADPATDGVQANVVVMAYGVLSNVELSLNGESAGSETPDDDEQVTFTVTLGTGDNTLVATAEGGLSSEEVVLSVGRPAGACTANLVSPIVPDGADSVTLGGDSCAENGDPLTTQVVVATTAGDGTSVVLKNGAGTTVGTTTVDRAVAVFNDVALENAVNNLTFDVAGDGGCATDLGIDFLVDCDGPDCSITSPVALTFVEGGEQTDFVNATMVDGNRRLTIDVTTSVGGQPVELTIDGGNVVVATADADGVATYDLLLAEGAHTVQATCQDDGGNLRKSSERDWTVDLTACGVDITAPDAGYVFVMGQELDLTATVTGDDCVRSRVAACDDAVGISGVDFDNWDGSDSFPPALADIEGDQTQCIEIEDRAGNVGLASLDVGYLPLAPMVSMLTPSGDIRVNLDGGVDPETGKTYTVTSTGLEGNCAADFRVRCSVIGTDVELFRGNEVDPFATAPCAEPGVGDDVPTGFGVATFRDREFQATEGVEVAIYATQTIAGTGETLSGSTMGAPIAAVGDCERPRYNLGGSCSVGSGSAQIVANNEGTLLTLQANAPGEDSPPDEVTFELTSTGGYALPEGGSYAVQIDDNSVYLRSGVELVAELDTLFLRLSTPDAFGNSPVGNDPGHSVCEISVVTDRPGAFTASAPMASWGPSDNGACPYQEDDGAYRVPVEVTIDDPAEIANRGLSFVVTGGASGSLAALGAIASETATYCVPVPADGVSHDVTISLSSAGGGSEPASAGGITVSSAEIASPAAAQVFADSDACDPGLAVESGQLAVEVTLLANELHAGAVATFASGGRQQSEVASHTVTCAGTCQATGCVVVDAGSQQITAQLDGQTRTVTVSAAPKAPENAITGLVATLPANDQNYRDGVIGLAWDAPADAVGSYELLCAASAREDALDEPSWLATAQTYALDTTPPATVGSVELRIGSTHHCMLRGLDYVGRATPLPATSVPVHYHFRRRDITVSGATGLELGKSVRAAGDLDGDGAADILLSGTSRSGGGRVFVYYGDPDGNLAATPQTTFESASAGFGTAVVGLGDFNGDDEPDIFLSDPSLNTSSGSGFALFGDGGRFVSREVSVSGAGPYTCTGADICYVDTGTYAYFGGSAASAGDFDNDGELDLVVGASSYFAAPNFAGRAYIIRGGASVCASPPCSVAFDAGNPSGFYVQGLPGGPHGVGDLVLGFGDVDGDDFDDVVLVASGGEVRYAPGRAFGAGLQALDWASLPTVDSGAANSFARNLGATANVIDNGESGVPDLLLSQRSPAQIYIYPGDLKDGVRFNPAARIAITDIAFDNSRGGMHIGSGYGPALGDFGGLDLDGLQELVVGDQTGEGHGVLFYGDELNAGITCDDDVEGLGNCTVSANTVGHSLSTVDPESATPTPAVVAGYVVEIVGDLTGDSHVDYVVANPKDDPAGDPVENNGRVSVLY